MLSKCGMTFLVAAVSLLTGQAGRGEDTKINPDWLFDTTGHRRSAEPSEPRVYPAKPNGDPDRSKLPVWTGDKEGAEYRLKANEATAFHKALDITSRVTPDQEPSKMPFKAGVYGVIIIAKPGQIGVRLENGNCILYNHVSKADVGIGDKVTPTTLLGKTGNLGTNGKPVPGMAIHLHIQAVDPKGRIIDPDQAFLAGRKVPTPKNASLIKPVKPEWVDVGPIYIDGPNKRPRVVDGVVRNDAANRKLYYDESASKDTAKKPAEDGLVGTWRWSYTSSSDVDYTITLTLNADGSGSFDQQTVQTVAGRTYNNSKSDRGTWKLVGNQMTLTLARSKPFTRRFKDGVLEDFKRVK
jgi:Lipocalin-like domain